MPKVLVVEDSRALSRAISHRLSTELGVDTEVAATLRETEQLLADPRNDYAIALLDLTLPDAGDLEVIDAVRAHHVPAVVFSGDYSDELRAHVLERSVIDYVVKDSVGDLAYVVGLVGRFLRNATIEVLVVDDSLSQRRHLASLLRLQNYVVHAAENGPRALELLAAHPGIKLVITDFYMPGMDGCELISRIRREHNKDSLAIIGVSSGGSTLSARFLKKGANDFITKPFINEEFFCRVQQNVELIEHIAEIRNLTWRDSLTGLWNRRWFFDRGAKELEAAAVDGWPLSIAMIDLDDFKKVNDTHGHAAGDRALRHVAQQLRDLCQDGDLAARIGGEEFVLLTRRSGEAAQRHLDALRARVASTPVDFEGTAIPLTISIGSAQGGGDLDALLRDADEALYQAKGGGRNRVVRSSRRSKVA